jgi:hypothetical protein
MLTILIPVRRFINNGQTVPKDAVSRKKWSIFSSTKNPHQKTIRFRYFHRSAVVFGMLRAITENWF